MVKIQLGSHFFRRINTCPQSETFNITIINSHQQSMPNGIIQQQSMSTDTNQEQLTTSDGIQLQASSRQSITISLNKNVAVMISKRINNQYNFDKSINSIEVTIDIESPFTYDIFQDIIQGNKSEIECDDTVLMDLTKIGKELEIEDLFEFEKHIIQDKIPLEIDNCIEKLLYYFEINSQTDIDTCSNFISSHFYGINQEQLKYHVSQLGFDVLQKIIVNKELKVKDEESLAEFIISIIEKSEIFTPLIESIQFDYCSDETITKIFNKRNVCNSIDFIIPLQNSFKRLRYHTPNPNRYFIPDEIRSKLNVIKNSGDFHFTYDFFNELSIKKNRVMMRIALDEGTPWDKMLILEAARSGNFDLVKLLIECGCNKDTKEATEFGFTPLIYASMNGHRNIAEYLVSVGANIEAVSKDGLTALIVASGEGYLELVEYLISIGANVNVKDKTNKTALMYACQEGHLEVVKHLISKNANKDAVDDHGNTPLMYATEKGYLEITKLFVPETKRKKKFVEILRRNVIKIIKESKSVFDKIF